MNPQDPPKRLGRGLDALLAKQKTPRNTAHDTSNHAQPDPSSRARADSNAESADLSPYAESPLRNLPIADIKPNPYQPRKEFRTEELQDLQASLSANGLLQPVTVRPAPDGRGYELVAGERRLRAATNLGWNDIPAIVRETDEQTLLTLAMIENLQRADLDPIEEADGYQRLADEFNLSQQEIADVVGKNRTTITNALRLLQLPASVRRMLQEKKLTAGHARALLSLNDHNAISAFAKQIADSGMSVREVERRVKATAKRTDQTPRDTQATHANIPKASVAQLKRIEDLLKRRFQTAATIHMTTTDSGEVRIRFFSPDDLERLLIEFGINPEIG